MVGSLILSLALITQAPPPPGPAVQPAAPTAKHKRPRGARSSRHHWLAAEATRLPKFKHFPLRAAQSFFPAKIFTPAEMSYWGNDVDGDCVTAEEFAAKLFYSAYTSYSAQTALDMPNDLAIQWATQYGYLQGSNITGPMDMMAKNGVTFAGVNYTDGPYTSVDYTDWATLTSAISQGPVKLGVAGDQLEAIVGTTNGWVAAGLKPDSKEDHCIGANGYGTMTQVCSALGTTAPAGKSNDRAVMVFTWDTQGALDYDDGSFTNIVAEAWLRTPTTPQQAPPTPAPAPTPAPPSPTPAPPTPTPTPTPMPPVPTGSVASVDFAAHTITIPSGMTYKRTSGGEIVFGTAGLHAIFPPSWTVIESP
jgi:hypothetical protein